MNVLLVGGAMLCARYQEFRCPTLDTGLDLHAIASAGVVMHVQLSLEIAAPVREPIEVVVIRDRHFGGVQQLLEHALVVTTRRAANDGGNLHPTTGKTFQG